MNQYNKVGCLYLVYNYHVSEKNVDHGPDIFFILKGFCECYGLSRN